MAQISQIPGPLHFTVQRGDTFSIALDFNMDLTNYTLLASAGSTSMTITQVDTTAGEINLSLTATQTATIGKPTVWSLKWTDPGNAVRTILKGTLTAK